MISACSNDTEKSIILTSISITFYPHMPISKVWIYRLLFVCVLLRKRISPSMIKLAASHFPRRFIGVNAGYHKFL